MLGRAPASSGAGSSAASIDGGDQRVLVGEDPEDRALGDAGRLGDLAGGDHLAVLEQQREGGVDDRRPPLVGRQGTRPLALDDLHHPAEDI